MCLAVGLAERGYACPRKLWDGAEVLVERHDIGARLERDVASGDTPLVADT